MLFVLLEGDDADQCDSGAGMSLVNNLVLKHFLEGVLLKQVKDQPMEMLQRAQVSGDAVWCEINLMWACYCYTSGMR